MSIKLSAIGILGLLFTAFSSSAEDGGTKASTSAKSIHPIDSSYGWVDSVLIEYFVPTEASTVYFTFNKQSVKIWSGYSADKIVTNTDTVNLMKNLVGSLFIKGTENTEKGRSYNSGIVMSDYDQIRIRLFAKHDNYLTHTIYTHLESGKIEFSEPFNKFYNLLKLFRKQIIEVR